MAIITSVQPWIIPIQIKYLITSIIANTSISKLRNVYRVIFENKKLCPVRNASEPYQTYFSGISRVLVGKFLGILKLTFGFKDVCMYFAIYVKKKDLTREAGSQLGGVLLSYTSIA